MSGAGPSLEIASTLILPIGEEGRPFYACEIYSAPIFSDRKKHGYLSEETTSPTSQDKGELGMDKPQNYGS